MPIKIDSVFYELALHDEEFAAALRNSVKNLDQLDQGAKKADKSIGGLENAAKSVGSDLKRMAEGLAIGLAVRAFVANIIDAQRALAQLQAAVRSTGGAAGFTVPELVKMSEEMSHLSTFSSEAVQGGLSRLLTYTGIQGPMFKEAARATLDFATALGIDTTSAAERVGNALQYPTEAINSLTKQGFRFTSEQKRLIAAFESTGQLAKAQAIILGELDLAYKGSAEAARSTLGGALEGLKNDFASTLEVSKETSGGLIEAINSVAAAMPGLRNKFSDFFGGISLMAVDASIRFQKFLNLFRGSKDKVSDADLEALRREATRSILGLDEPAAGPKGKPAGNVPKGLTDAQIQAQKAARAAFAQATAALTPDKTDNFDATVDRLVAAAKKAHLGTVEIAKMVAELRSAQAAALSKEGRDLSKELQAELAKSTGLQAAELKDALDQFDSQIREKIVKGVPVDLPLVTSLRAAKVEAIGLAESADHLAATLLEIDHNTNENRGFIQGMRALNDELDSANADFAAAKATGNAKGMAAAQERINTILAAQKKLQEAIAALIEKQNAKTRTLGQTIEMVSGGIANLANVAFGLVSAFSGANSELAKMLGSIGQAAGGIESLMSLANTKDAATGVAPGLGGILGSKAGLLAAAPAIGQIIGGGIALASALFGKSPEEQRRLELMKLNNQALAQLSKHIGDLGRINVTGTQLGQLTKFFQQPQLGTAAKLGALSANAVNQLIGQALTASGLSAIEFKNIMRSFGLAIDDASKITINDVNNLKKAILESELTQFADTFEGQMSQFNAAVKIFDLSKPIDQFTALRKAIGNIAGGGGALGKLLDTFDLTTAGGINDAITALENLFAQLQSLSPDQAAAFLGGLTPEQFEQLIEQTIGIVRSQAANGGVAGTGGFNVDRTITEVTGNRLEALLSTDVIWNQRTAENTSLIAQLLGGGNLPVINPPASSTSSLSSAGGPLVVIENLTVQLSGLTDPSRAQEIGSRIGTSVLEEIDRGLGKRLQFAKLARGQLS